MLLTEYCHNFIMGIRLPPADEFKEYIQPIYKANMNSVGTGFYENNDFDLQKLNTYSNNTDLRQVNMNNFIQQHNMP